MEEMSEDDLLSGRKGETAKCDLVGEILLNKFRMPPKDIENNVVNIYITNQFV